MTVVDSTHPTPAASEAAEVAASAGGPERWRGTGSVANTGVLEGPAWALVRRADRALRVPADRSALRRSLGRAPSHPFAQPAHRIVGPWLPAAVRDADDAGVPRAGAVEIAAVERAFYTVAALIAAQPRSARDESSGSREQESSGSGELAPGRPGRPSRRRPGRSLGRCLADAVNGAPAREQADLYGRLESRLRLLCRQDVDGLHGHLPRLVRHLRSDQIPIDWVRLLIDLARWGIDADGVAKTWLQHFYGTARPARLDGGAAADSEDITDRDGADGADDDAESERP